MNMKKKYYGNLKNRKQFLPLSYGKAFQNAMIYLCHMVTYFKMLWEVLGWK